MFGFLGGALGMVITPDGVWFSLLRTTRRVFNPLRMPTVEEEDEARVAIKTKVFKPDT